MENIDSYKECNNNKKAIDITGKTNRYMIKKLIKTQNIPPVKRKQIDKWNIDSRWFTIENQLKLLTNDENIIQEELIRKISSYKQQDILKKRLNKEKVINYEYIKNMLLDCNLNCYYCSQSASVLYETQRDMSQWTIDRIDNNIGHDINNVVISCLKCNLQRKSRDSDKFLQTKQMVIKRENHSDNIDSDENIVDTTDCKCVNIK